MRVCSHPFTDGSFLIFTNSSEYQQNEKTDYANLFAIGWIFISEYSERLQEKGELTHV